MMGTAFSHVSGLLKLVNGTPEHEVLMSFQERGEITNCGPLEGPAGWVWGVAPGCEIVTVQYSIVEDSDALAVPCEEVPDWSDQGLCTPLFQNIVFRRTRQPEGSLALVTVTATPLAQLCQMLGRNRIRSLHS